MQFWASRGKLFAVLTTYIIGCIALIIKPGPDLMCTLATALSDGKARASTLMVAELNTGGRGRICAIHRRAS